MSKKHFYVLLVKDGKTFFQQGAYYTREAAEEIGMKYYILLGWDYKVERREEGQNEPAHSTI